MGRPVIQKWEDTSDILDEPTSGIQILKVKKGTTEGLASAVFRIEADGKIIGHYVTDERGWITISNLLGTISVTEEVLPVDYVLDENDYKDIEVTSTKEPTIITF